MNNTYNKFVKTLKLYNKTTYKIVERHNYFVDKIYVYFISEKYLFDNIFNSRTFKHISYTRLESVIVCILHLIYIIFSFNLL